MRINAIGINYTHSNKFHINRPYGSGDYLFLYFKTKALLTIEGKTVKADKNSVILYNKDTPQIYSADQAGYANDFIHFDTEGDLDIHSLPFNTVLELPSSKQINKIIKDIYLEYISNNAFRTESMDLLLRLLFVKVSELAAIERQDKAFGYYDALLHMRSMIYRHPEEKWTISRLSGQMNLSPSHFQRLYKQTFKTTCIADVIFCKIQYAKTSLTSTTDSIRKIALRCGYENEEHFMRQFKHETGMTPTQYRNWMK